MYYVYNTEKYSYSLYIWITDGIRHYFHFSLTSSANHRFGFRLNIIFGFSLEGINQSGYENLCVINKMMYKQNIIFYVYICNV